MIILGLMTIALQFIILIYGYPNTSIVHTQRILSPFLQTYERLGVTFVLRAFS